MVENHFDQQLSNICVESDRQLCWLGGCEPWERARGRFKPRLHPSGQSPLHKHGDTRPSWQPPHLLGDAFAQVLITTRPVISRRCLFWNGRYRWS